MKTLGTYAVGRDNNLNIIRMVAASAVLVSHAYPIASGVGTQEPLKSLTGYTLGSLSVFAFFIISGFLIAASFERTASRRRFMAARCLRLFPGLIVSLLLVALIMGPLVTTLPVVAYFTDPATYNFLLRNTTLVHPQYTLPGVFETNPYPTVEGSIWTLIHEVACYVGVLVLGVLGVLAQRKTMVAVLTVYLVFYFGVPAFEIDLHPKIEAFRRLSLPFAFGTALYIWRDQITLRWPVMIILIAIAWVCKGTPLQPLATVAALGYTVFWLAYVPAGFVRAYNRLGDYSYGMYIYAFPAQGLTIWIWGPMSPIENMLWSFPMTLAVSVLSWHWVEQPALGLLKRNPNAVPQA